MSNFADDRQDRYTSYEKSNTDRAYLKHEEYIRILNKQNIERTSSRARNASNCSSATKRSFGRPASCAWFTCPVGRPPEATGNTRLGRNHEVDLSRSCLNWLTHHGKWMKLNLEHTNRQISSNCERYTYWIQRTIRLEICFVDAHLYFLKTERCVIDWKRS